MENLKREVEIEERIVSRFTDNDVLEEGLGEDETEADEMDTDFAEEDEENIKVSGIFRLTERLQNGDEEIRDIRYDFGSVTPIQYINICKKISKKENLSVPELNQNVQFTVFCRAAGIPVSVLKRVGCLQDFTAMCQMARDFLLMKQGDSEDLL